MVEPIATHQAADPQPGTVLPTLHQIEAESVPLSPAARHVLKDRPRLLNRLLTGGDDYELVFTAPPARARALKALSRRAGVPITRIGVMTQGSRVRVVARDGRRIPLKRAGYTHF